MNLPELLLQTLLVVAPPGHSKFSIVPFDCQNNCSDYKWSTFYNSYVRTETLEDGKLRYSKITEAIVKNAKKELCLDDSLNKITDCQRTKAFKSWTFVELTSIISAAMIAESGIREDVMVGRGYSGYTNPKNPLTDDAGGQGIGPGKEVCLVQIHPKVLARFNIDPQTFLGESGLENCFSFGMDMLGRSRNMCSYQASKTPELEHDWVFETFSMYGTGYSCASANSGRTAYRKSLYIAVSSDFGARVNKEKKKELKVATLPLPPPQK
jgi:hypothetical protein